MYFYRPLLLDGRFAPIAWEIYIFYFNFNWPIGDNPTWRERAFKRLSMVLGFFGFLVMMESEVLFVIANLSDIDLALEGLCPWLLAFEMFFRVFNMALRDVRFKRLLDDFFHQIYIERAADPKIYRHIQRKLVPTRICAYSYILTLFSYFCVPLVGYFTAQQLLPFRMHFHFDNRPMPLYLLTLAGAAWLGIEVVSHLSAESNLLAMFILHLNARFQLLQRDLDALHAELCAQRRQNANGAKILQQFRTGLIDIVRRNVALNAFAAQLQAMYSFSIFIMMALSALLICVLGFKVVTVGMETKNVTFILWMIGKIVEILVFGELGSTIIDTTSQMGTMYYKSNWEQAIMDSPNKAENVELMKNVIIAMALNQQPFQLTGFNFFTVSFETVIKILQGAGSYFTCLYAFR